MIVPLPVTVFVDRAEDVLTQAGLLRKKDVHMKHVPNSDVHWAEVDLHVRKEDLKKALKLLRAAAKKKAPVSMRPYRDDISITAVQTGCASCAVIKITDASGTPNLAQGLARLNPRAAWLAPVVLLGVGLALLWRSREA